MSVRMSDIARDLKVSVITVSKAIRNRPDISEETRARVLKRVKELNYSPNPIARALVTKRTHVMGLVVPDLVHSFFAEMSKGLSSVLRDRGYSLVISCTEEDPEIEKQALQQLLARRVDALLIASAQTATPDFRDIEEQKVKYVLVDRNFSGLSANFVGVRDRIVGEIATRHLIETGCRIVAHIGGRSITTALRRMEGYRRALASYGLPASPEYIVSADQFDKSTDAAGYRAASKLLSLDPRPDGIFCFNDPVAIGAMKAILEAGLRIPDDVALIGCGNLHFDDALRVPLSSIDQKSAMMGEQAARLAIDLVEGKASVWPRTILLEPQLVIRESTRRLHCASK